MDVEAVKQVIDEMRSRSTLQTIHFDLVENWLRRLDAAIQQPKEPYKFPNSMTPTD